MKYVMLLLLLASPGYSDCRLGEVLQRIRPLDEFVAGTTYDSIRWIKVSTAAPTRAEVDSDMTKCTAEQAARAAAKLQARYTLRLSTSTQAQKISALILLLDLDR